jgi:prephenate dehydrogenase
MKICIIGLGLIGGSLAKAIRYKYHENVTIFACDTNIVSLEQAKKEGIINQGFSSFDKKMFPCSFLFLCTHIEENIELLKKIEPLINEECILTDVSSVKREIHKAITNTSLKKQFIGGHPMTGSEKKNYNNSARLLFENAYYILTPAEGIKSSSIKKLEKLITDLNAIPLVMNQDTHDYCVAGVSHFPHLISALLINSVNTSDSTNQFMAKIAAGGFKDITRISSSSPNMWKTICFENKENLLIFISNFQEKLDEVKLSLLTGESPLIENMFERAKEYRDSLKDTRYTTDSSYYIIHVDIPDVPGILASVVSLLANNMINIKNIGIIHNREFRQGALQIEFYTNKELQLSIQILKDNHYILFL